MAFILKESPNLEPWCSWVALLESQKFDCGCKNYSLPVTSFLSHVSTWLFFCNKARILLHPYLPPKKRKKKADVFKTVLLDKCWLNKAKTNPAIELFWDPGSAANGSGNTCSYPPGAMNIKRAKLFMTLHAEERGQCTVGLISPMNNGLTPWIESKSNR